MLFFVGLLDNYLLQPGLSFCDKLIAISSGIIIETILIFLKFNIDMFVFLLV